MAQLTVGTRLRSAVCTTEVMVVAAPEGDVELTCGGSTMIGIDEQPPDDSAVGPGCIRGHCGGQALHQRCR